METDTIYYSKEAGFALSPLEDQARNDKRYRDESLFHSMVQMIAYAIIGGTYTVSQLVEGAHFAEFKIKRGDFGHPAKVMRDSPEPEESRVKGGE